MSESRLLARFALSIEAPTRARSKTPRACNEACARRLSASRFRVLLKIAEQVVGFADVRPMLFRQLCSRLRARSFSLLNSRWRSSRRFSQPRARVSMRFFELLGRAAGFFPPRLQLFHAREFGRSRFSSSVRVLCSSSAARTFSSARRFSSSARVLCSVSTETPFVGEALLHFGARTLKHSSLGFLGSEALLQLGRVFGATSSALAFSFARRVSNSVRRILQTAPRHDLSHRPGAVPIRPADPAFVFGIRPARRSCGSHARY